MAETTTYQCPNCNGRLSFDGSVGKLRCEFCDSTFTPQEVEALFAAKQEKADSQAAKDRREEFAAETGSAPGAGAQSATAAATAVYNQALKEGKSVEEATAAAQAVIDGATAAPNVSAAEASTSTATQVKPHVVLTGDPIQDYIAQSKWNDADADSMRAYNCPACGAQLMVDQVTAVTSCPYCGNNAVVPGQLSDVLKPDYVIPFKLNKEEAVSALKRYYQGKPLLPNDFTANNHIEEIQGVYVPFWLYSGTGLAEGSFEGRNTRTWSDRDNIYTETDHYQLYREGNMQFRRVPVDGSTKMPDAHMDAIEPYDYSEMVPFSISYLPGFLTDRYDLDVEQCDGRARKRVKNTCEEVLADTANGYMETHVRRIDSNVKWTDISYALLPVWMLHTRWNGQDYLFAMNGQTGKFIGDLPIDSGKVRMRFLLTFLPVFIVVALIIFFVFGFGM